MGRIRRLTIYSDKIKSTKKILVYSDLHLGFKERSNIKEVFTIPELSPSLYDYILIPGDIVHSGKVLEDKQIQKDVVDKLAILTGTTPTYVSLGNHDQFERFGFETWSAYCANAAISTFNILPNMKLLDINQKIVTEDLEFSAINNSVHYYLEKHESSEFFEQEVSLRQNKISFTEDYFSILLTHDPKSIYRTSVNPIASATRLTEVLVLLKITVVLAQRTDVAHCRKNTSDSADMPTLLSMADAP